MGGGNMFLPEDFKRVNGFSNRFYTWGGEDMDMSFRFVLSRLSTSLLLPARQLVPDEPVLTGQPQPEEHPKFVSPNLDHCTKNSSL